MSQYAWFTRICVITKSAWMAFVLHLPIVISCLLKRMIIYFKDYTKLEVIVWMNMRLFLARKNLIFFIVGKSTWYNFCFGLNIFTNKISNLLLPLRTERLCAMNLDIPTIKGWTTTKHWNQIYRGRFMNPATNHVATM